MAMEFIVEIIHEEIIKPSSPTPLHLKTSKLSLFDQVAPMVYVPLIFCYRNDDNNDFAKAEARSQVLKTSLSKTLTRFYPFAGRLSSSSSIECNDQGVDYVQTRVNCRLQDILKQPVGESLAKLLPSSQMGSKEAATKPLLLVKVNFFECGSMAIGINFSHKVADLFTMKFFIKTWAAMAQQGSSSDVVLPVPDFKTIPSLFPPLDLPVASESDALGQLRKGVASRRLVFDASKISMLKAQVVSRDVPQPTRVEAVAGIIWKCAMAAAKTNRGGFKKQSGLLQVVDLRKRMNPPLPQHSTGSLQSFLVVETLDCETELQSLVKQLRNGMRDRSSESSMSKLQGSDAVSEILLGFKQVGSLLQRDDLDVYFCSSWCRFELYESADFGWGKPKWVSNGIGHENNPSKPNSFILMDSMDGEGIEARVNLVEGEMAFFECNRELLAFASVNPCVKL
ncbi:Transferase [Corchorus capsularis]|uniref:Transferase n=1 Tax=Corchorus capsularis TaxID=210143 RepID=A0A1R3GQR4_COCAP|nr:Transferase [Corchorus capsularis]